MGLLDQFAAFAVTRMRGRLDRPGGRPVEFSASGFWLVTHSFIGYPGLNGRPWWDQVAELPIARLATIASIPTTEFRNDAIKTTDVMLVSGLSFSGSSGSPVLNLPKSVPSSPVAPNGPDVPSKIIGIMSGHFWENPDDPPKIFRHSGLSYLTKSTAILELIATARAAGFRRHG